MIPALMKFLIALSLLFSLSAYADFGDEHADLCSSPEAKKLMGSKGSCQLVLAPMKVTEVSAHCEGKLSDITCRVMVLKTSDSASMTLVCGDVDSPLLSQVLEAEVVSYTASAIVKKSNGDYATINDPKDYHLLSNAALDVELIHGEKLDAKMVLTLQNKSIALKDVVCE